MSIEASKVEFILKVLNIFSKYSIFDALYWTCDEDDEPVSFMVNCNDLFWWGSGDAEQITPANIHLLEPAIEDCKKIADTMVCYGPELFVATVREMRPQGSSYPDTYPENKKLWPLYDACGPKRKIDGSNPYKPGEYKQ